MSAKTHLILVLFAVLFIKAQSTEILEFDTLSNANKQEIIYLDNHETVGHLDASFITSRYVYFIGNIKLNNIGLNFSCQSTARKSKLSEIKFCCRLEQSKRPNCNPLPFSPLKGKITCNGLEYQYSINPNTGANFFLTFKVDSEINHSSLISCSLKDSHSVIESNVIEMRDGRYYLQAYEIKTGFNIQVISTPLTKDDFPLKFECGDHKSNINDWPLWLASVWKRLSPFAWGFCSFETEITAPTCAIYAHSIPIGQGEVMIGGSLYLISDSIFHNPSSKIALICYNKLNKVPILAIGKASKNDKITEGLSSSPSTGSSNNTKKIIILSPIETNYTFLEGATLDEFNLQVMYRKPNGVTVVPAWYKDNGKDTISTNDYIYMLPKKVEKSMAGRYTLKIITNGVEDVIFIFNIIVLAQPKFSNPNCMSSLFYAMESDTYQIECRVEDEPMTIKIGVNGIEASTAKEVMRAVSSSIDSINQPLKEIDLDFKKTNNDKTLILAIKNLKIKQNFKVSMKASNSVGYSKLESTVRVVPKPVLHTPPSSASCSSDCMEDYFTVPCIINEATIESWQTFISVSYKQTWLIEMNTLESLLADPIKSQYFRYNPKDPTSLGISPMKPFSYNDSTNGNELNKHIANNEKYLTLMELLPISQDNSFLSIECRIQIYVNDSQAVFNPLQNQDFSNLDRRRKRTTSDAKLIYDSYYDQDNDVKKNLVATRTFVFVKTAQSSLAWVAAIIISILLLLAVVVITAWLCTREKGETYKLYRKECESGKNPLQELKEHETFLTYERPEEPPVLASRYSINEEGLDVGSDEDGELDGYNMDPGTFNEDASYVGQYGSPVRVPMNTYSSRLGQFNDHNTAV